MSAHLGTAIVTGGASGLGLAFARTLAALGHDVAVLDLAVPEDLPGLLRQAGSGQVYCATGDASYEPDVRAFAQAVREGEVAPVRVVVNNVGVSPYADFEDVDLAAWHRVLHTNLDSMFLVTQAFRRDLITHDNGRVVNLTSSVVADAQARSMTAYATSKAAVIGFTRSLAGELGEHGVTVNAIAPGIVVTPDIAARVPQARLDAYRERQSVHRLAVADDVCSALEFLVAPGSGMVTGTVVPVNGGRVWL